MRISLHTADLAGYFAARLRQARQHQRNARLRRELARLPAYVARDIDPDHGI